MEILVGWEAWEQDANEKAQQWQLDMFTHLTDIYRSFVHTSTTLGTGRGILIKS